jgi:hypothetical protein
VRGAGGVEGAAWDAAEVVGVARVGGKVGEAGDEGAAQVRAVGPPRVAI